MENWWKDGTWTSWVSGPEQFAVDRKINLDEKINLEDKINLEEL